MTESLSFESEPNSSEESASLREFNGQSAIGFLEPAATTLEFQLEPIESAFVDISSTATPLELGDDGSVNITTSVGNSFFPAGQVSVNNNGALVAAEDQVVEFENKELPVPLTGLALFPFWDDLGDDHGNVFWEERDIEGHAALVVQWDDRQHFDGGSLTTFQAQVFESGPDVARFIYRDVAFGDPDITNGASATIGYQFSQAEALQFSFNTKSIASNRVLRLREVEPSDGFRLVLQAGNEVTLVTEALFLDILTTPSNSLDPRLEVWGPDGQLVAADTDSRDDLNARVSFVVEVTGDYVVNIFAESGVGDYLLLHEVPSMAGDFDVDGQVTDQDIDLLCGEVHESMGNQSFDLDCDSMVDSNDLDHLIHVILETEFGDMDLDGDVDFADFVPFSNNFGQSDLTWSGGDFNCDGQASFPDFVQLSNAFGFVSAMANVVQPISRDSVNAAIRDWGEEARRRDILKVEAAEV